MFTKEEFTMEKNLVSELLIRIGVNPSYRGYPYLTCIILQAASAEDSLFLTSKVLYQASAEYFHDSTDSIKHSILTLLDSYLDK